MPVFEEPHVVGFGLTIILSGVPVFMVFIKLRSKMSCLDTAIQKLDIVLQKFFYAMPDLEHED